MATLIITILFGLGFTYFAIQNTGTVTLNFLSYSFSGIPTYLVVVGALLVGLLFSFIISLFKDIETGFTMRGKENKIKDYKKENVQLLKENHQLELENTRLKATKNAALDDRSM